MGFSSQDYWSGLPFSTPGDLLDLGIKPASLESPALAGKFFTTSITWDAHSSMEQAKFICSPVVFGYLPVQEYYKLCCCEHFSVCPLTDMYMHVYRAHT